jgi:hypothetical protein
LKPTPSPTDTVDDLERALGNDRFACFVADRICPTARALTGGRRYRWGSQEEERADGLC